MNVEDFNNILNSTSAVITGNSINAGRDRVAIINNSKTAQFSAILDQSTCKLCKYLDGLYFKVGSEEYKKFTPRIHQNCRCIWVYIGKETNQPKANFKMPPDDLIEKHGSLLNEKVSSASVLASSISIASLTGYSLLEKQTIQRAIKGKDKTIPITGDTIVKASIPDKDFKVNDKVFISEINEDGNIGIIINGRKKNPFNLEIKDGTAYLNKTILIISAKESGEMIGIIEEGE